MMRKILSLILTAALALTLTGCGEEAESSKPAKSSSEKTSSQGSPESSDKSSDDTPGSSEPSGGEQSLAGRHIYKTVVFRGSSCKLYTKPAAPGFDGSCGSDYRPAVVIDYNTSTGKITRIRYVIYFNSLGDWVEDKEQRDKEMINGLVVATGEAFAELPYTTEEFKQEGTDNNVTAIIRDIPDGFEKRNFAYGINNYFLGEYSAHPPQDIDGYISSVFYNELSNMGSKPLPYFGENCFTTGYTAPYNIYFFDGDWAVDMKDELNGIRLYYPEGVPDSYFSDWSPADYGSTSYNTGGGYSGTYNYRDYLR